MNNVFLILGGDNRSLYLGEYLEKQGYMVCYFGFSEAECFDTLCEAVNKANFIILPLPFSKDRVTLNTPLYNEKIQLNEIIPLLTKNKFVFGGQLSKGFCEELTVHGVDYFDYFSSRELAIYNAVPTAEGIIKILIEELPETIRNMEIGIVGYGKVGKVTSDALKSLGGDVTVISRNEKSRAECFCNGLNFCPLNELKSRERDFSAIINTVPTVVLNKDELAVLKPDCLLIEVASKPYGIDFEEAKKLALKVIIAGSLPGKVAPKTAGEIIGKEILNTINRKGLII